MLVLSNDWNKNTLGGESSKYGCNLLEFYYSSTYDAIYCAPMNVLRKHLFIPKNFLMLSFARSTAVKNKSEGVDVGPPEWIQWRAFIENLSNLHFVFIFCSYFHLDLNLIFIFILYFLVVFQFNDYWTFMSWEVRLLWPLTWFFSNFPMVLTLTSPIEPTEIPLWNKYDKN